ncbi:NAD(P)H-dependent oxidoreductase [Kiritimatiellota bacterium B12222]|nr:NAD(P)H-dependent oxidoreductase [Kiritimatiellota bacterium B12222]
MKTILAFSGSSRENSLNAQLLQKAVSMAAELGASVEVIDLKALNLPLYDGDLEQTQGLPEGAKALKEAMQEADGFLIASPEYNSFPTPLLLNALDWASRAEQPDEIPMRAFKGKTAGLIAATPGPMGGLRSLSFLRSKLQNMGVTVVPTMTGVGGATIDLFADENFATGQQGRRLHATLSALLHLTL